MTGRSLVACFAVATTVGCSYPVGILYTGTTTPDRTDRATTKAVQPGPTAKGEACASGVLGLVAWGDASVAKAKKNGGLNEVYTVESKLKTIVGIYTQGCTIVTGPTLADGGVGGVAAGGADGAGGGARSPHGQGGDQGAGGGGATKGAMHGDPAAGHGGGTGRAPPEGGTQGDEHRGPTTPPPNGVTGEVTLPTYTQVPYSFVFNARSDRNHQCQNFDPNRWAMRLSPIYPTLKPLKDAMNATDGAFASACPTADLRATCDYGDSNGMVEYFYTGINESKLLFIKLGCLKWNWVIPPPATPLPPASSGPLLLACDPRAKSNPEQTTTTLSGGCVELRPTDDPNMIMATRATCGAAGIVARCPTQGMTGRCDAGKGGIHYYYGRNGAMGEAMCKGLANSSWSAPRP